MPTLDYVQVGTWYAAYIIYSSNPGWRDDRWYYRAVQIPKFMVIGSSVMQIQWQVLYEDVKKGVSLGYVYALFAILRMSNYICDLIARLACWLILWNVRRAHCIDHDYIYGGVLSVSWHIKLYSQVFESYK